MATSPAETVSEELDWTTFFTIDEVKELKAAYEDFFASSVEKTDEETSCVSK
jgi:hypothetical protein